MECQNELPNIYSKFPPIRRDSNTYTKVKGLFCFAIITPMSSIEILLKFVLVFGFVQLEYFIRTQ